MNVAIKANYVFYKILKYTLLIPQQSNVFNYTLRSYVYINWSYFVLLAVCVIPLGAEAVLSYNPFSTPW